MSPSCPKAKVEQPKSKYSFSWIHLLQIKVVHLIYENLIEQQKKLIEAAKSAQDKLDEFMKDITEIKSTSRESPAPTKQANSSFQVESKSKSAKKVKLSSEPLDPMDPSSYSDVPR